MNVADVARAWQAQQELTHDDFDFLFDVTQREAWPVYLGRLESQRLGVDLLRGWVPATFLVA